jgi:hypothetical protein
LPRERLGEGLRIIISFNSPFPAFLPVFQSCQKHE